MEPRQDIPTISVTPEVLRSVRRTLNRHNLNGVELDRSARIRTAVACDLWVDGIAVPWDLDELNKLIDAALIVLFEEDSQDGDGGIDVALPPELAEQISAYCAAANAHAEQAEAA